MYRGLKSASSSSGGANNVAQQIAVLSNLPAAGGGTAWEILLWVSTSSATAYGSAHFVGARSQTGSTLSTNSRYNFTTDATRLPTITATVDSVNGTVTLSLAAALVADGNVSYQVRFDYRVLSETMITDQPTLS